MQPTQNRVLIRFNNPAQVEDAARLLRDAAQTGGTPEFDVTTEPGAVIMSLSPVMLRDRAERAIAQCIEIVRRRIDQTGVLDPVITKQGENRIVVQLPGVEDPNRIKELIGRTARMTFRLLDETANPAGPPPPGVDFLAVDRQPGVREPVRRRVEVDGASLTIGDRRAGPAERRLGDHLHLRQRGHAAVCGREQRQRRPALRDRAG